MEYYDYKEWVLWPENDVREYAVELAAEHRLTLLEANFLNFEMNAEAGHWPEFVERFGPSKMSDGHEELFRSIDNNDDREVFAQNKRMNKPIDPSKTSKKYDFQEKWESVGSGITHKRKRTILSESKDFRKRRKREERKFSRFPFAYLKGDIDQVAKKAMWRANCYPIGPENWLISKGNEAPHEGLVWYVRSLHRVFDNARTQANLGNIEAAMWHAFNAGTLCTELKIRLAYGQRFEKYEAVSQAQRDAAISRKVIPDEVRRDAYWLHRKQGNKRIEAGRLAAKELGISEASVRNAFPEGKYPAD